MRLLVVEDDEDLRNLITENLKREGYQVDSCGDGEEGLFYLREKAHALALMDRMLPCMDGLSVVRQARSEGVATPVLMMTALGSLSQVIDGLDAGADDYIVKPFAVEELMARVRALLRRPTVFEPLDEVSWEGLVLYPTDKKLECGSKSCSLSKRECDLLDLLIKNGGKTLPRAAIFSYVWGYDTPVEDANLDNYIRFVRERLREVEAKVVITTVRGVGYRLEQNDV